MPRDNSRDSSRNHSPRSNADYADIMAKLALMVEDHASMSAVTRHTKQANQNTQSRTPASPVATGALAGAAIGGLGTYGLRRLLRRSFDLESRGAYRDDMAAALLGAGMGSAAGAGIGHLMADPQNRTLAGPSPTERALNVDAQLRNELRHDIPGVTYMATNPTAGAAATGVAALYGGTKGQPGKFALKPALAYAGIAEVAKHIMRGMQNEHNKRVAERYRVN